MSYPNHPSAEAMSALYSVQRFNDHVMDVWVHRTRCVLLRRVIRTHVPEMIMLMCYCMRLFFLHVLIFSMLPLQL